MPAIPKIKGTEGKEKTCHETWLLNMSKVLGQQLPREQSGLVWRVIHGNVSYQIDRKGQELLHVPLHSLVFKCADFSVSRREKQQISDVE